MITHIDCHIGARLRARRRVLGLSQRVLGDAVGVRFQQIQKYECAANGMTAGRLWALAVRLGVGINYFFDGLHLHGEPLGAAQGHELKRSPLPSL